MPGYSDICLWFQTDKLNALKKALAEKKLKLEDKLLEKLEEIDKLNEELEVLRGGISREDPAPTCPTCCAQVQEGDEFCRECGGKL